MLDQQQWFLGQLVQYVLAALLGVLVLLCVLMAILIADWMWRWYHLRRMRRAQDRKWNLEMEKRLMIYLYRDWK